MKKCLFWIFIVTFGCLISGEEEAVEKIRAHMVLKDYRSADFELQAALNMCADSIPLRKVACELYAETGQERSLISTWNQLEDSHFFDCLQTVAWGVLQNGSGSSSPKTRFITLLAAFLTRESKAVSHLERGLQDQNIWIRQIAAHLCSQYPDRKLQKALVLRLKKEKIPQVRLTLLEAIGSLKIQEAKEPLEAILESKNVSTEEMALAVSAYTELSEQVDEKTLQRLCSHPRAGMRLLGCALVEKWQEKKRVEFLRPLLRDSNPQVRSAVLRLFHWKGEPAWENFLRDSHPEVAVVAAWCALREGSPKGEKAFQRWLSYTHLSKRRFAAAALSKTGTHGVQLMEEALATSTDPLVNVHLSLGLMGQKSSLSVATHTLVQALKKKKTFWTWQERGGITHITESRLVPNREMSQTPKGVDLIVQMELIGAMALAGSNEALPFMRKLLKEQTWGSVWGSSMFLLTEGPKEAPEIIEELIDDPDPKVALQAALALSSFKKDKSALEALEKQYQAATRKQKELILEALGQIGSKESIPFLAETLNEPHQHLRLIAASSLLLCYH